MGVLLVNSAILCTGGLNHPQLDCLKKKFFEEAVGMVKSLGKGPLVAKMYIESSFRRLPARIASGSLFLLYLRAFFSKNIWGGGDFWRIWGCR